MKNPTKIPLLPMLWLFVLFIALALRGGNTQAAELPFMERNVSEIDKTERLIDLQERPGTSGRSPTELASRYQTGQGRAKEVVALIQEREQKKMAAKISERWGEILSKYPGMKTPAAVAAAGAEIWYGKNLLLIRNSSVLFQARMEVHSQSGGVEWGHTGADGGLVSSAKVNYRHRERNLSTQFSQRVANHIALNLTATSGPEASSEVRLVYQMVF